jgi:hypothetical protein
LIPDITHRSRIGAHEDLDRFFGIIKKSFEFLFCGRFARGLNLDFLNVDQTCDWVWFDSRSIIFFLIFIHIVVVVVEIGGLFFDRFGLLGGRKSRAFLNAKITLELEIRLDFHQKKKDSLIYFIYLFPYKFWTRLGREIDRPNATTRKVGCSCYNLFVIRSISVVEISKRRVMKNIGKKNRTNSRIESSTETYGFCVLPLLPPEPLFDRFTFFTFFTPRV